MSGLLFFFVYFTTMPVSASIYRNLVNDELKKNCLEYILGTALFWAVKRVVVVP